MSYVYKWLKGAAAALVFVLAGAQCVSGQSETLDLVGNLPRINLKPNTSSTNWSLDGNSVLFRVSGAINAGQVVITQAAKSSSLVLNEGGVSVRGTGFPSAKLHVGFIDDATQPGEVKVDPGNPAAIATIFAQNKSISTELRLQTLPANQQAVLRLMSGSLNFAHLLSGQSGRYLFRDAVNNVNPLTIFPGASNNNTLVLRDGKVGMGVLTPTAPLQLANGATCSAGGVWTNASSRTLKQDIKALDLADAKSALAELKPVTYAYKNSPEENNVGFIAEDVPEIVATKDRKGLSSMDVAAVLTKVVQDQESQLQAQQQQLQQQAQAIDALTKELEAIKSQLSNR